MLIATVAVVIVLLALSFIELKRWNEARSDAHQRQDDIYFIPTVIVYPMLAILAIGSIAIVCIAARQTGNSPYGWVYFSTAVLCSGLCLAMCIETRRTFIKFDGDEMIIQSFARRRSVRVSEIERVTMVKGAIVFRLRSGRAILASNVLGWNVGLRTRLDLLRPSEALRR